MGTSPEHITLNTGASMPLLGLGTWKSASNEVGQAVEYALSEGGYHHIDCAAAYENEKEIGESLKIVFNAGAVQRKGVFITSKLWNTAHARGAVRLACEATLEDLGLEYLDLYLVHWGMATSDSHWAVDKNGVLALEPISYRETWEAMEELVAAGLVKAIGVANLSVAQLIDLLSYAKVKPAMNQIELHPYLQQSRLVEFCQYREIAVTAYSPLGRPGAAEMAGNLVEDETILKIARAHKKTPAQVLLRWGTQRNTVVIPKSTHPERIKENIDVFNFELSKAEMDAIAALDRGQRLVDPYQWGKIPYFG
ncbi:aldo/keto reductase [Candidatus Kaiserbacteria bacterium]|nr:aldo/keto reductase [Candidatus Kaiserbacteria bacterium]